MRKLSMPFAPTYFGKWERKFRVFNYYISDSQFDSHWCIHTVTKILVTSVSLSIVLLRNDKKGVGGLKLTFTNFSSSNGTSFVSKTTSPVLDPTGRVEAEEEAAAI